jgi:hypothetical protein
MCWRVSARKAVTAMRFLLISLTPCGCSGCVLTGPCTHPIPADARLEQHSGIAERGYSSLSQEDAEGNKRPLDIRSSLDRRTVGQWDRICEKLAHHAEPRRFSLYVHCVVKDYKTAERIAKPLRRLQLLDDLAISFGQRNSSPAPHDEQLLELAKATVQATKYRFSFPFMDLPTELQLHILKFTDLVRDRFEYIWLGGRLALGRRNKDGSNEEMMEASRADGHYAWLLAEAFCAKRNLAFRDRCRCNEFPVSYLLVSRRFRNLALEVFYGRNRFVASYNNIRWCTATVTTISGWNAPPLTHVLQHITRVILVASIRHNVRATIGFNRLVELLRAHARLPSLTLELHVRDVHPRDDVVAALRGVLGVYHETRHRRRHTEIYRIIFRNIRKKLAVAGLKAFLLYLWWENFDPQITGDDVEERRAMEREKEKEAMGKGYDSENWGKELQRKPFPRSSLWQY